MFKLESFNCELSIFQQESLIKKSIVKVFKELTSVVICDWLVFFLRNFKILVKDPLHVRSWSKLLFKDICINFIHKIPLRICKTLPGDLISKAIIILSAIRRRENGWYDEEHPLVFLFLGSSGIGKFLCSIKLSL